ncbi:MAG: hypothetical protein EB075_04085 [Bacteroidetes bacterium]|nr:hypothetical protein [Bacteroidota bacterium]
MSSTNVVKAALPTIPDAGDNIVVSLAAGVVSSVDLGAFVGKFVRIYSTGTDDVFLSAGLGLETSVTDPTDLAGANPGMIVYGETYQDTFVKPFAPLAPAGTGGLTPRSYFMKLLSAGAQDVLICVTSQ